MAWSDAARAAALVARRAHAHTPATSRSALHPRVRKLLAHNIRAMRAGTRQFNTMTIVSAKTSTVSRNLRRAGKPYIVDPFKGRK